MLPLQPFLNKRKTVKSGCHGNVGIVQSYISTIIIDLDQIFIEWEWP